MVVVSVAQAGIIHVSLSKYPLAAKNFYAGTPLVHLILLTWEAPPCLRDPDHSPPI